MGPLVVVVTVAGASAWWLAQHFSQRVLDQWLYDSAATLANQVRFVKGEARLDVPGPAIEMFEVDMVDQVFFEVATRSGERLMANAAVPALGEGTEVTTEPTYYDTVVKGLPVRAIALLVPEAGGTGVVVRVAETRNKRDGLANEILVATLAIVAMLSAAAFALVSTGIGRSLSVLEPLVRRVRGAREAFHPLPEGGEVPSEIRPLVKTVNALMREIAQEHTVRRRFVADAAHQLRTPLAALRVQLDVARREADPQRHREVLDEASATLARTSHLIHRLLSLSRVDQAAEEPLAHVEVDLDRLARDEVEAWIDRALARGIDLGFADRSGAVVVAGRAELLREALSNLVDNAMAYAGKTGPITVGVAADPPSFYVEDCGPGIPAAEHERVTRRFYRIAGTPGEGCGLGLAIVEETARVHGATFRLRPGHAGRGLRAELVFPAGLASAP